MATVLVTGVVQTGLGRKDSRDWKAWSPVYREGADGEVITTRDDYPVRVVAGVFTARMEPGVAVIENPDGKQWTVTIPDEDADLWEVIATAVAFPPDTAQEALASAVTTYLDENPVVTMNTEGITDSGPVGRTLVQADTDDDAFDALSASAPGRAVVTGTAAAGRSALDAAARVAIDGKADHGASGGGSVNATTALQAAIDAAQINPLLGVAVVQIPDGTYKVTSSLVPKSRLTFQGAGDNVTLDFSAPTVTGDDLFDCSDATLEKFTLRNVKMVGEGYNAGGGTEAGVAVRIRSTTVTDFTVENVWCSNFRYGINASSAQVNNPKIRDCKFYGNSYAAVRLRNSRRASITGNFVDCTRTGIGDGVAGRVGIWCAELSTGSVGHLDTGVHDNHVFGASAEGINVHAKYATVTGNTVSGCDSGIMFEPFIMTSPGDSDANMISTIAGNTARDCTQCIVVRHDPINNVRSSAQVAITGNATTGGNVGIRIGQGDVGYEATYGPLDITLTGNVCVGHGTRAIRIVKARRVAVGSNIASGTDCGLSIEADTKLVTVTGGCYRGTGANGDGIRIEGSASYLTLSAFTVDNCTRYGVFITGTTDNITLNDFVALDDQGSPTMDNAVFSNSTGTNIIVGGNPMVAGTTGAAFSGVQKIDVKAAAAAVRLLAPLSYQSGYYYFTQPGQIGTASLGNGNLRVSAWVITETVSVTALNAEFTVAGESGSVFRIGVWLPDGLGGMPSTLVVDAGTVATDGTPGVKEVVLGSPLTLTPGLYWVGGAVQNAPSTQPTMRTMSNPLGPAGPVQTTLPSAGSVQSGYLKASVTGALGTFSSPGSSSNVPRIGFKVA